MSQLIAFAVYDSFGNPNPAATPVFVVYNDATNTPRTPPPIASLGGGLFSFDIPDADVQAGIAYLINAQSTPAQYFAGSDSSGPLQAFALYSNGAPIAGQSPVFSTYVTADGQAETPPTIVDFGSGLYAFVIPAADFQDGVSYAIASGAGLSPGFFSGSAQQATFVPPTVYAYWDISPALFFFLTGVYTLTRSAPAAVVNGRFPAPTTATYSIAASVQPVKGRDLQILPEGLRTRESKKVFSGFPMRTQGAGREADQLLIDGVQWQVQHSEYWAILGNYYMALVQRTGNG